MSEPWLRTPFGEVVPARDGACSRRDVAVAWAIVLAVGLAFAGLSAGAPILDTAAAVVASDSVAP